MEMGPKELVIKQEIKEEDEVCFQLIEAQSYPLKYVKEESVSNEIEQVVVDDSCVDLPDIQSCFVVDGIKEENEIKQEDLGDIQINDDMEFKEEEVNCEWMTRDKVIRIPGDTLIIDETEKEIKYRKKNFPDFKEVSEMKLLCTVCRKDVSRGIISGKKIFINNTLGVLVCGTCHSFYGDGLFPMDEDGDDKFCRWCGDGGNIYCCAKCICGFCRKCIRSNFNRTVMTDVRQDDWICFVCHPEPLYALRSLCWAASKYYDYVNEKKDKREKKDKQDDGKRIVSSKVCDQEDVENLKKEIVEVKEEMLN